MAAFLAARRDVAWEIRARIVRRALHDLGEPWEGYEDGIRGICAAHGITFGPRRILTPRLADSLEARVSRWLSEKVYVLTPDELPGPPADWESIAPVLFCRGERSLFQRPGAAVLNSRKPRRISPSDSWLRETRRLVERALQGNTPVVSSYGTTPHGTVNVLSKGAPLIVVCPEVLPWMSGGRRFDGFLARYGDLFDLDQTLFMSPFSPGPLPREPVLWGERDRLVAALASCLFVAEIRRGGTMEALVARAVQSGASVVRAQEVSRLCGGPTVLESDRGTQEDLRSHEPARHRGGALYGQAGTSRAGQASCLSSSKRGTRTTSSKGFTDDAEPARLIHYTRSCPGPWPGQTVAEYCRSLLEGEEGAGHTAFDTLVRILRERRIRGSTQLTRGKTAVVSFTELRPGELEGVSRWRRGLIRYSFDPYGIAVRTELLRELGAEQVIYGDEELYRALPPGKRHLFQIRKPGGQDWSLEREWRFRGDLDLVAVGLERVVLYVPELDEARILESRFGMTVIARGSYPADPRVPRN